MPYYYGGGHQHGGDDDDSCTSSWVSEEDIYWSLPQYGSRKATIEALEKEYWAKDDEDDCDAKYWTF